MADGVGGSASTSGASALPSMADTAQPGAAGSASAMNADAAQANMHYDVQGNKWIFENPETGEEMEWNEAANAWVPVLDEEVVKAQQAAYSVAGVDEATPAAPVLAREAKKKRKLEAGASDNKKAAKAKPAPRNTAVYVQGLPLDATVEEVSAVFSKAGLILLDADGEPKIKLYSDSATGMRNGDGLVVYYKEESVQLAISLLDDTPLRLGDRDSMRVARAEWSHKGQQEQQSGGDGAVGSSSSTTTAKRKPKTDVEKQKMQRRAERLQREAADYDPSYDEKDSPLVELTAQSNTTKPAQGGKVVVLQHVFTLEELAEDPSLLLDLKEDVRDECESLGRVTNVVLYDKEPDGIVTIKFADPVSAQACVLKNNNRFFGGRQLKAWLYDGKKRYRKSGNLESEAKEGETAEDAERRRLEEFGRWLEEEEGNPSATASAPAT